MKLYLYYDVKSIQSFLFKIPRLKYIVGGSALIDQFDKETVTAFDKPESELIFSGGGRGAFLCRNNDDVHNLKKEIIKETYKVGLDIQFGQGENFSQAALNANELYPFLPDEIYKEGLCKPCPVSGLYPVRKEDDCHKIVKKRLYKKGERIFRHFEKVFLNEGNLKELVVPGRISVDDIVFFHNVNSDDPDEKKDNSGKEGAEALGNRNRWAVIYMDGNDIGSQFRAKDLPADEMQAWVNEMSQALSDITNTAASKGIQAVISEWAETEAGKKSINNKEKKELTLPIRPLIIGGDDLVVLCHCSHAFTFVKEVSRVFNDESREKNKEYKEKSADENISLWPATNGELTISAGILFAPVTTPLHMTIPYAEALLDSAKELGREKKQEGQAVPACIDWEQITETVIDTPEAKRKRELIFEDKEIKRTVKLTQRPYTLEEFVKLEDMADGYKQGVDKKLPRTVLHKILPALKKSYAERLAFYASIKKKHKNLFNDLNEYEFKKSKWELKTEDAEKTVQSTKIIDAIMILEEKSRMENQTVQKGSAENE